MRTTMISLLVVTVALLACKKEEDKTEAPRAEATPAATPVAPAPEPTPAEPARRCSRACAARVEGSAWARASRSLCRTRWSMR